MNLHFAAELPCFQCEQAVPWHNKVVVGTTDTPVPQAEIEPRALPDEIEFLISHAARYLSKDPTRDDVLSVYAGLRPLVKASGIASTAALSRDHTLVVSPSGLVTITGELFADGDIEAAMANSVTYLEACGHIVVAWIWLQQLLACGDRDGDFYAGKRQAARYFFRVELPRTDPQLDLLAARDRTALDMRDSWF